MRRIVAVTGESALAYVRELEATLARAARAREDDAGRARREDREARAPRARRSKSRSRSCSASSRSAAGGGVEALLGQARDVGGVKVLGVRTDVTDRGALRELAEKLRDKLGDSIVLVGSEAEGKAQLVLTVAKALTDRYKAGDLIRRIAEIVGGSGGGRPDMAQAGGTDPARLDEAIEAIYAGVAAPARLAQLRRLRRRCSLARAPSSTASPYVQNTGSGASSTPKRSRTPARIAAAKREHVARAGAVVAHDGERVRVESPTGPRRVPLAKPARSISQPAASFTRPSACG